jgi:alkanesulfonate monooxygenase SsuD/methylene tetrahydromethanopterin reductase-like flavin-dependent oxidoreductase (luciferase family)
VRDHIAPRIRDAAARAGRPEPRVVAGVPVCVTDDVAATRAFAAAKLGVYGGLPAYRAMLEREGVAHPENLLVAGSEAKVRDALAEYAAAGTTDLRAGPLCATPADAERTRVLLASLARGGGLA